MEGARTEGAQRHKGWLRAHAVTLILLAILLVGVGFLLYPTFSNWWNEFHQSRAIMGYAEKIASMDDETYAQMIADAQSYNARLAQTGATFQMTDEQEVEYDALLNVDGTGIMGYITIPKIDVQLPIYHGTDDAVLQSSIGHFAGSSLPVGGLSTHTVLSGHRGLPSAKLFSDLDQLVEGDTFTITVLNETLTYEVDQIHIVEPDDLSDLKIEEGQDLCTLVTCTPYGINTHRLLVRGHRIPNANGDAQVIAEAVQVRPQYIAVAFAVPVLAVLVIYLLVRAGRLSKMHDMEARWLDARGLKLPRATARGVREWDASDGHDEGARDDG